MRKLGVNPLDLGEVLRSPKEAFKMVIKGAHILHLHWPEYVLSRPVPRMLAHMALLFGLSSIHRMRGGKVVWTVHNLSPHENRYPLLEAAFYRALSKIVDGLIFLSRTSCEEFKTLDKMEGFRKKPRAVIPHGHYFPLFPRTPTAEMARRELGLPEGDKIVLHFGAMRPYKGTEEILQIAGEFHENEGVSFLIAGKPVSEAYKRKLLQSKKSANVYMHLSYVSEDRLPLYFAAADLVLLPYTKILNSGTSFLSMTFGKPVMAPRQGSLVELEVCYPNLVHLYEPPLTKEKLLLVLNRIGLSSEEARAEWKIFLADHDWRRIAERTLDFYLKLLGS